MISALSIYEASLLQAGSTHLVRPCGTRQKLPVADWVGEVSASDEALLGACIGPTLDIGCGPGRLTTALIARGIPALGVDVSPVAVRMTRRRGGPALLRNVFAELPGTGRWHRILLADGNIGIGGDPVRLLRRCAELLSPAGAILVDLEPPGTGLLIERIRLANAASISSPFHWCWLGVDALDAVASAAGLVVIDTWLAGDRWQASLGPDHSSPRT